jgi:hypothetical protein
VVPYSNNGALALLRDERADDVRHIDMRSGVRRNYPKGKHIPLVRMTDMKLNDDVV